jgi:glycosyltransferase involved in cell wall biosynthesis
MGKSVWEGPMKISIAATNPCHLYPLALELARANALGCYYSGYPAWKLNAPAGFPVRTHSFRTTMVYGALKYLHPSLRPSSRTLFLWQDHGFDAWVGRELEACDFLHAMPGQALKGFERARALGVRTVLNHATGPGREWVRIMEPEYQRVGLRLTDVCPYDEAYFAREEREYELADYHCAASSVVRQQLTGLGIAPERIWLAGYGADPKIFHARGRVKPGRFRVVFAGQIGLRKGIRTLLQALAQLNRSDWEVHFYGGVAPEARDDLDAYPGATPMTMHGSVSQAALAEGFRKASVLVLPSLEEGFGLVIPQGLNCGLPCIVSDRVGGKDLIRNRENGSVFPAEDPVALAAELGWWERNWRPVEESHSWAEGARQVLEASRAAGG